MPVLFQLLNYLVYQFKFFNSADPFPAGCCMCGPTVNRYTKCKSARLYRADSQGSRLQNYSSVSSIPIYNISQCTAAAGFLANYALYLNTPIWGKPQFFRISTAKMPALNPAFISQDPRPYILFFIRAPDQGDSFQFSGGPVGTTSTCPFRISDFPAFSFFQFPRILQRESGE